MIWTPWGYTVDELPPIIDESDFERYGLDSNDLKTVAAVESASMAVRAYCGWHVSPELPCFTALTADGGNIVQLPALLVTGITSVTEDGAQLTAADGFEWTPNGSVRRCGFRPWTRRWQGVQVSYTAGLDTSMAPILAQVVKQLASNALAPAGVRREQAGGVSIDWNTDDSGQGGSMALTESMKQLLAPFRLPMGAR